MITLLNSNWVFVPLLIGLAVAIFFLGKLANREEAIERKKRQMQDIQKGSDQLPLTTQPDSEAGSHGDSRSDHISKNDTTLSADEANSKNPVTKPSQGSLATKHAENRPSKSDGGRSPNPQPDRQSPPAPSQATQAAKKGNDNEAEELDVAL